VIQTVERDPAVAVLPALQISLFLELPEIGTELEVDERIVGRRLLDIFHDALPSASAHRKELVGSLL
jgi:hypothetical protein